MTIHINIDTNPDPDCISGRFAVYTLYPPCDELWSLEWCSGEDMDDYTEIEEFLCRVLSVQRECGGCLSGSDSLPRDYESICAGNDIVIHKVGERLEEC